MTKKILNVYNTLLKRLDEDGALHLTLIDPDSQPVDKTALMVKQAERGGTDAIMIGGSTVEQDSTDECVMAIKEATSLPTILFPGNITGVSRHADAIFFMTLLNSRSTYWLAQAQAMGAYTVKKNNIEPIPMGYIVFDSGKKTSVEFYGDVNTIPNNKPKIAAAYGLAAEYMGMKVVYFEGGSGASEPVSDGAITMAKKLMTIPLIVGGGIRTPELAAQKVHAGADMIVSGTLLEESGDVSAKVASLVKAIKRAGKDK